MTANTWKSVDEWIQQQLVTNDEVLEKVLKRNREADLPAIEVSATEGKFLHLLAKLKGATRILEIGTLGGYSTIWLARALPKEGKVLTLEYSDKHAEVARTNIQEAGLSEKVTIMTGAALDSLSTLPSREFPSFDFIFIDADKRNNPSYVKAALELAEPGACLVVDNVVRDGKVLDPDGEDPDVQGIRQMFEQLKNHPRIDATAIQTVGSKGYDGFLIAVINE